MKIGELASKTGVTTKTIRFYELHGLLEVPRRTESGYRIYSQDDVGRLEFIKKAKHIGLSLEEIKDILAVHKHGQRPCVHVLALLDRKLEQLQALRKDLGLFYRALKSLRDESRARLEQLPKKARICGIIERGIHLKGEIALAWLERHRKPSQAKRS